MQGFYIFVCTKLNIIVRYFYCVGNKDSSYVQAFCADKTHDSITPADILQGHPLLPPCRPLVCHPVRCSPHGDPSGEAGSKIWTIGVSQVYPSF